MAVKRAKRKMTNKEQDVIIKNLMDGQTQTVNLLGALIRQQEQIGTLLHLHLLATGHARKAMCDNCNSEVVYPTLKGMEAFPVCPNSEESEECQKGFDWLKPGSPTMSVAEWDEGGPVDGSVVVEEVKTDDEGEEE